jgi:4-amino-4-deoxy-L-arabinose transferase-like glycosyltransferase
VNSRRGQPGVALIFALMFAAVFTLHLPLLQLPYFWDEAGYYVPAARDLLLTGSLIPHSTVSNAHPPLVMAYLALCWKLAGYSPAVTRTAMLLVAAFSLLGLFRLARRVANTEVAVASTVCTMLYPIFFVQSSLAQVDLAAAGLTFWALDAYIEDRWAAATRWFALATLAKETAVLAPLALAGWAMLFPLLARNSKGKLLCPSSRPRSRSAYLLLSLAPLILWYAYHYLRTGYIFGNPEFFRYNVQSTLNPLRILLALAMRAWQTFGYMHLGLLTLSMLLAMWVPPMQDAGGERPRIALSRQSQFCAIIASYVVAMSFIGGAVLARYMLPAVPLIIIIAVSTLWRRVRYWRAVVLIVVLAFVAALFVNPPYGFSIEDNLAYRDYIRLHQDAETFLEARYPMARVLTAWPASDEITRPYLGYLTRPMRVFRIEDFSLEQLLSAAEMRSQFDVALVFSTKYEPPHPLLEGWAAWERVKARFFGFHRDLLPAAAVQVLGGRVVFSENRNRQWIAVIEMERVENAGITSQP